MGYRGTIYLIIAIEDHLIYRRSLKFDWDAWADPAKLPIGIAALLALLIGWAVAIVSMDQVCRTDREDGWRGWLGPGFLGWCLLGDAGVPAASMGGTAEVSPVMGL